LNYSITQFLNYQIPMSSPYSRYRRRPFSWLIFFLSSLATISLFLIPAFIIYPFRHQSGGGLAFAMALRQRAPWGTLGGLLICIVFALVLWQPDNLRRKIVLSTFLFLVAASAVMSRLNYFEWMFHPVDSPQFEAESASKLNPGEMIMAVAFPSDDRAYPISQMAYHHILNDVVGGMPIAVTY
jgi:Protein of unknown function (DUF3179)